MKNRNYSNRRKIIKCKKTTITRIGLQIDKDVNPSQFEGEQLILHLLFII